MQAFSKLFETRRLSFCSPIRVVQVFPSLHEWWEMYLYPSWDRVQVWSQLFPLKLRLQASKGPNVEWNESNVQLINDGSYDADDGWRWQYAETPLVQ